MRPFALIVFLLPSLVLADATDDLLEAAAEQALLRRDATIAAAWVSEAAAARARGAYEKALAVASVGGPAREVAVGFLASRLRQLRDVTPEPVSELDSRRLDEAVTAALERRSGAPIRKLVDGLSRKKL